MYLNQAKIDEIRQNVDIVEVVSQYLTLHKKGRNYVALCPFHEDTNPSMSISSDKQIYKCFVCGAGGNVFNFVSNFEKISFQEAVLKVGKLAHIDVSEYQVVQTKTNTEFEPIYKMHSDALAYMNYQLKTTSGEIALRYLKNRQLDESIINHFNIGYDDGNLNQFLLKKGYEPLLLLENSIINQHSGVNYDVFANRVVFAIHDEKGNVIGYTARSLNDVNQPKYINSTENKVFIKSQILYNYHRAKEACHSAGSVIILEGPLDVIALYRAGIYNAVATMGTALTKQHLNKLRRLSSNVIVCYDGDEAGINASLKAGQLLTANHFNVEIVKMKKGYDPDEIIKDFGVNELKATIENKESFLKAKIDFLFSRVNQNNHDEIKQFISAILESIDYLDSPLDREYYFEYVAKLTGFNKNTIESLSKKKKIIIANPRPKSIINRYQKAEQHLLYFMMHDKNTCFLFQKELGMMYEPINRLLANYIVAYYQEHDKIEISDFISTIDDQELINYITTLNDEISLPIISERETINEYISTIKQQGQKLEIDMLKAQLKEINDPIAKGKIANEINKILANQQNEDY